MLSKTLELKQKHTYILDGVFVCQSAEENSLMEEMVSSTKCKSTSFIHSLTLLLPVTVGGTICWALPGNGTSTPNYPIIQVVFSKFNTSLCESQYKGFFFFYQQIK